MNEVFVPGQYYKVPCVEAVWRGKHGIYVVMGPRHSDAGIIGFDPEHWHMHPQFAPERAMRRTWPRVASVFSMPIHDVEEFGGQGAFEAKFLGLRRRKCLRELPDYPMKPYWHDALTESLEGKSISLNHPVCPHRGADLSHVPVKRGCITCPLHGLRFSARTGAIMPWPTER